MDEANPTTLNIGDLKGFGATVVTEDATNKLIKIESSDPEVLEVIRTNAGDHYTYTLHALKQGTATLTITSNGNTAQGQPVTKQVEITINEAVTSKEELEAKIEEANTILENENLYTNTSLDVLKNALKPANDIDQKEDATQTEVNAQVVQLFKAIQQLEYRGSNEGQPDSENPIAVDPENVTATTSASEGPVGDAFDGNPGTYWHSGWEQGTEKLPQSVTIDLNNEYDVEQVNYLPRQGSRNGDIVKYQIETSEDGENFKPVVVGTIENDGTSIVERTEPHKIKFDKTKARYVRITALESLGNQNNLYASAAEFSIFGALHSDAIPATSIELDKTELKLDAGNTETVTATILREDTTDSITWESSDPAIASVEAITSRRARRDVSGTTNTSTVTITALKAGTATITAKANDTVSTTLTVTVENPKQEQLSALIEKVKAVKYENAALQDYVTSEIEKAEQALDKDQDTLQNAYYALAGALSESEAIQKDIDQINSFNSMDDSRYAQNDKFTLFK
ncbi:MAG: discoidin domain-containing protein [Faecalicoccus sp.]|uniref:discoidin domain-containing protein n=1 Tax=Faecalicoccus sp. TaxID=1971758 RepID=UPI002A8137C3|nr:discoidin domain-containing protein [Faecalicoccus sp.]MDY4869607.1 discoidin domain-containing protein [Faecalicoccus sp.]